MLLRIRPLQECILRKVSLPPHPYCLVSVPYFFLPLSYPPLVDHQSLFSGLSFLCFFCTNEQIYLQICICSFHLAITTWFELRGSTYMRIFSINTYYTIRGRLNPWMLNCRFGGLTVKLYPQPLHCSGVSCTGNHSIWVHGERPHFSDSCRILHSVDVMVIY